MNYYSASVLEFLRNTSTGRSRHVKKNHYEPKSVFRKDSTGRLFSEQQYCDSIVDFGDALGNMQIGTPFCLSEWLNDLGDEKIINAVAEVLDNDDTDLYDVDDDVWHRPQVLSYRSAIVIKSSKKTEDHQEL